MLKSLKAFKGENGSLFALNKLSDFQPKRFFYVTNVPKGELRGHHAHLRDKQLLVCVKGSIHATLDKGGTAFSEFVLREGDAVFMDTMTWGSQRYLTGDDILLVLCSEEHDEEEYIKDYNQFLQIIEENKK